MINIKGLDKAEVLQALYVYSKPQGLGFLSAVPDSTVTIQHCKDLLKEYSYFDYLYGKVMKVDLSRDEFNETLYDLDNGAGTAQKAVDTTRKELTHD